jgi:hypothetical protein
MGLADGGGQYVPEPPVRAAEANLAGIEAHAARSGLAGFRGCGPEPFVGIKDLLLHKPFPDDDVE